MHAPITYKSRVKRFIYFKNPKCGSTSILKILYENNLLKGHSKKQGLHIKQEIQSTGFIPAYEFKDFLKFSFVRNPYSRVVSLFEDKVRRGPGTHWEIPFWSQHKKSSFVEFVRFLSEGNNYLFDRHSQPQYLNLNKLNGFLPEVKYLNFIGRVETFDEDLKKLCQLIGFRLNEYPKKNISKESDKMFGDYKDYYCEESKNIISQIYKKDLELFKYDF